VLFNHPSFWPQLSGCWQTPNSVNKTRIAQAPAKYLAKSASQNFSTTDLGSTWAQCLQSTTGVADKRSASSIAFTASVGAGAAVGRYCDLGKNLYGRACFEWRSVASMLYTCVGRFACTLSNLLVSALQSPACYLPGREGSIVSICGCVDTRESSRLVCVNDPGSYRSWAPWNPPWSVNLPGLETTIRSHRGKQIRVLFSKYHTMARDVIGVLGANLPFLFLQRQRSIMKTQIRRSDIGDQPSRIQYRGPSIEDPMSRNLKMKA